MGVVCVNSRNLLHRVGNWRPYCYHNFSDQQRHARAFKCISMFFFLTFRICSQVMLNLWEEVSRKTEWDTET